MIALAPAPASNTCTGKPRTFRRNQITPTCERTIVLAGRLRDEAGIGAIAALQGRERADAGALLLDHGLEMNARGRLQAGGLDRIQRIERADGARLHVAGAAAVHLAVLDDRRERRRLPHVERPGRHHVAMALQDQRFAGIARRAIGADHGARLGEIMLDRAEAAQILQILDVDMPVVDLVAALRAGGRRSCPGTALRRRGSRGSQRNPASSPVAHRSRHRRRRGFSVAYRSSCGGSSREFEVRERAP